MKGEQGKPNIKSNLNPTGCQYSSEKEWCKPRVRHNKSKKDSIMVDREEMLSVDRKKLPADVVFKGYEEVVTRQSVPTLKCRRAVLEVDVQQPFHFTRSPQAFRNH